MRTMVGLNRTRRCTMLACIGALLLTTFSAWAKTPVETTRIVANDSAENDFFGFSIDLFDDTAVIGALRDDDNGADAGSVYVFVRSGTRWQQQAKFSAADSTAGDEFGGNVALDGASVVIGARNSKNGDTDSGSAYVYTRSGTAWLEQAKLTASDGAAGDEFGYSVAISGDTAIIGAPRYDNQNDDSGAAYVFTRSDGSWKQQAKLVASDGAAGDVFGISVAISSDTVMIGADLEDQNGSNSGAAYMFKRTGNSWRQQAKLTADDGAAGDLFGIRVALSGDTAVVGAARDDDRGEESGAAYVFVRSGSKWTQQAKLNASDGAANDRFGTRVAIRDNAAVIGAILGDATSGDSGSAYLYTRNGSTWSEQAKLTASDGAPDDVFGWSVALHGNTVLIGAPTSIITTPGGTGSVYAFDIDEMEITN